MNMASPALHNRPIWPWLSLSLVIILADQLTKSLVIQHFQWGDSQTVTSYFNLVRAHNPGAAFSFLANQSGWQRWFFIGIGMVAGGFIVWQLHLHRGQRLISLALALILGGALGNVIDRMIHGHVIDFLDFHWPFLSVLFPSGHFPAFNIADACITMGALGLITSELRRIKFKIKINKTS